MVGVQLGVRWACIPCLHEAGIYLQGERSVRRDVVP